MRNSSAEQRGRGVEILDHAGGDPALIHRSLGDVAVANALLGGTRAVMLELRAALQPSRTATLVDAGTGAGDIPERAREIAARAGIALQTIGVDLSEHVARASRARVDLAVCADVRLLPFGDRSVDVVTCSQTLHHFFDGDARQLVRELNRIARVRVIVSDLRRSRVAAAGIWAAAHILGFHPVSRHDGVVSVMRGFTPGMSWRIAFTPPWAAGRWCTGGSAIA